MAKGRKTGGGSRKGKPNALTKSVKEAVQVAFDSLQEDKRANLLAWGKANPTEFYRMAAKLIPAAIDAKVSGSVVVKAAQHDEGL